MQLWTTGALKRSISEKTETSVAIRFSVLGSGSGGNASLLEIDGFGLLIDLGFGPRQMTERLAAIGRSWDSVDAAVLTHVHTDHWTSATLRQFFRRRIPLYCHSEHFARLRTWSAAFQTLESAGLALPYATHLDMRVDPEGNLQFRPFPLSHDCRATFGFRITCGANSERQDWSMAYAADLGTWTTELVAPLAEVDLLALEFNHDVELQKMSGRPADLIERVLSDEGHLSNEQAAGLLESALRASTPGRLRGVVQLHLSRECNRPHLAREAAERALEACGRTAWIETAEQHAARETPSCGPSTPEPGTVNCGRPILVSAANDRDA